MIPTSADLIYPARRVCIKTSIITSIYLRLITPPVVVKSSVPLRLIMHVLTLLFFQGNPWIILLYSSVTPLMMEVP